MTSIIFKKKSCKVLITYALVLYLYHKKNWKKFQSVITAKVQEIYDHLHF